ncbi:MAG: hypothetical protein ACOX58_05760 [Christensenellales bacterium]|jgi:hypothetical protein
MNFDFLKDLRGLGYVYENCNNAEKLAMTMPVQSMFTARKSAELLAKFIYLAAHNEKMESMNFVDILGDPTVRDFINDRKVMNAFHFIRKSGNRAVHSEEEGTVEDAIDVLEDLHFVAGQTACMLGLIKDYPSFNSKIESYPEAKYVDEQDIEEKVHQMFVEYVTKYNAQIERDQYYQNCIDNLMDEFDTMVSRISFIPGDVELNEVLEFKEKPLHKSSIKPIQNYFGFMAVRALKKLRGELPSALQDRHLQYSGELTIYGEDGYTTSNLSKFVYGIMHDLPFADGFKITSYYYGPSVAPWFTPNSKERKKEFSAEIVEIGKSENLTYMIYEFLYNHGEGWIGKYENGEWVKLKEKYATDILDKDFGQEWWCFGQDLIVDFDLDKYPDILEALHSTVRKKIPEDQICYCEQMWTEDDPTILCNSISWYPTKLRVVQDFLDEINEILKPIINECDGRADGNWYIIKAPFAVATWNWTDEGFKITGIELGKA